MLTLRVFFALGLLSLLFGSMPHAVAQAPAADVVVLDATQGEGMALVEFVDWFTKHAPHPVTYAPPAKQIASGTTQKVRFDRPVRVPKGGLLRFTREVLFVRKLAILEMGEGSATYYLVDAMDKPTALHTQRRKVSLEELASLRKDYVLVSCTVPLKHAPVQQIQTRVQRMQSRVTAFGSAIIPLPSQNAFLIHDFAPNARAAVEAIRSLDVKGDPRPFPASLPSPQLALEIAALKQRVTALEAALKQRETKAE